MLFLNTVLDFVLEHFQHFVHTSNFIVGNLLSCCLNFFSDIEVCTLDLFVNTVNFVVGNLLACRLNSICDIKESYTLL